MAVQNPFFGRREPDALAPRSPSAAQPHHHSNGVAPSTSAPTATAPVASSAPKSSHSQPKAPSARSLTRQEFFIGIPSFTF